MIVKRKYFSSNKEGDSKVEKPKRPKHRKESAAQVGLSLTGLATLGSAPMAGMISGSVAEIKEGNRLIKEVNERLQDIVKRAQNGDVKAAEFLHKYYNDRGRSDKLVDAIKTSPRVIKAKKKAALVPLSLATVGVTSLYGANKMAKKIKKVDDKYREELKDWKKSRKK
jgi:hypothetical protein